MEESVTLAKQRKRAVSARTASGARLKPVGWTNLRDWLALVESHGQLKRIASPVDPDEELSAITYMATRREDAPALLFSNLKGDRGGSSVVSNMLGASKERYALAVGIDPSLDIAQMIEA
ncbi:MAG: hypothetical protein AB7G35_16635, partial [Hyphomicrobiaceae bacterium]